MGEGDSPNSSPYFGITKTIIMSRKFDYACPPSFLCNTLLMVSLFCLYREAAVETSISVLVDPTDDEIKHCPGLICIALTEDGRITGLYKYGKKM